MASTNSNFDRNGTIPNKTDQSIFLAIDHLRAGKYVLKITEKNQVVKSVKLSKKQ